MKVVLDTNVLVSGIFFSGPPSRILDAWSEGRITLILSPEILEEYRRVGEKLHAQFSTIEMDPILALVAVEGVFVDAPPLEEQVCSDPDDDKFLSCARAAQCPMIISGDKQLLATSGFDGITVLRPREFVDHHLEPIGE